MKHLLLALVLISTAYGTSSFADDPVPPPAADAVKKPVRIAGPAVPSQVRVTTSMGSFVIELNAERAPLSVANFLKYVDQGQYTNTLFHRVIPNFVIQGGGFDVNYKLKPAAMKVVNEAGNGLSNSRTTVGMARGADPHGSDCQFYINLFDNAPLDPSQTRWGYAVFGRVTEGMEVVDRIGNVITGAHGPLKEDTPLKPVIIEKIERIGSP